MDNQETIKNYYNEGTYYGSSSSCTMYQLAAQLELCNNEFLWFAIVGHTEFYMDDKIDILKYEKTVEDFQVWEVISNISKIG